ncbi:hypothetical protein KBJ98_02235 [Flavobacterium sp. F-328]|uniref:Uncharacterized protein n=1 Tax=Flavobacterium erciyesense TaxID=2825842 RepID=A0ABS5D0G6_9FLAO|nr:hypothetical protein [Flavobacterium erciyesense]MBQ0907515.1 hypothetical protein [Flavobacterium erciyesense]
MSKQLIELTTHNGPIIIGIAGIATIEPSDEGAKITLLIARSSDLYPKAIYTTETYEEVKSKLEL